MILFTGILFYMSIAVIAYLCISRERQLLTHDVLENKVKMAAEKVKQVVKYSNKNTLFLMIHLVVERFEELFLKATQKIKEAVPKSKKRLKKMADEAKAKVKKSSKKELPKRDEHDNLM